MKNNLGTVVLRDGIAAAVTDNALAWVHDHHSYSYDHAVAHEGYSFIDDDVENDSVHADVRGWYAYLDAARGRSYGGGRIVYDIIRDLHGLSLEPGRTDDYLLRDEVVVPMIRAARMLLNYTEGNLSLINGRLDEALLRLADTFGVSKEFN